MRIIVLSTLAAVLVASTGRRTMNGADAAPAEGLTPFGFFMARTYGEPVEHAVMKFIAFKPSDGAKFRETFEKKHGPRGRDLIDSLGSGSYKTATDPKSKVAISGTSNNSKPTAADKNPLKPHQNPKQ